MKVLQRLSKKGVQYETISTALLGQQKSKTGKDLKGQKKSLLTEANLLWEMKRGISQEHVRTAAKRQRIKKTEEGRPERRNTA